MALAAQRQEHTEPPDLELFFAELDRLDLDPDEEAPVGGGDGQHEVDRAAGATASRAGIRSQIFGSHHFGP